LRNIGAATDGIKFVPRQRPSAHQRQKRQNHHLQSHRIASLDDCQDSTEEDVHLWRKAVFQKLGWASIAEL
jgi:hypothetical protein